MHTGAQIHSYFLINVLISERNLKVTLLGTVKRGIRPSSCTSLLLSSEDSCIHTYGNEINFKFNLKFTPTLSLVYTYSMFNCNTHSYLCTYGSACATTMGSDVRCVLTCSYLPPCTEWGNDRSHLNKWCLLPIDFCTLWGQWVCSEQSNKLPEQSTCLMQY